jgi:hypothetical protein
MTAAALAKSPGLMAQISQLICSGELELAKKGKQELRSAITDRGFLMCRIRSIRMQVEWKIRNLESSKDPAKQAEAKSVKNNLIMFLRA